MDRRSDFALGIVLLAAGESSRMGRPKMLLPWGETTVIGHLIDCWSRLQTDQIAVVCAAEDPAIQAELDRLGFPIEDRIFNPLRSRGMFSSVQCAARWNGWKKSLSHWAIVLGDQPHVQLETLRAAKDFAASHPQNICQTARNGHGRHPVFFPRGQFKSLAGSNVATLKDFLQSRVNEIKLLESSDAGLDLDLDYPADYEVALRFCNGAL